MLMMATKIMNHARKLQDDHSVVWTIRRSGGRYHYIHDFRGRASVGGGIRGTGHTNDSSFWPTTSSDGPPSLSLDPDKKRRMARAE
jgi:hypothetical protein